jgi:hypothetical protein
MNIIFDGVYSMSLASKARRFQELDARIVAEQKKLLTRALDRKNKSIAIIRATRGTPGTTMCELLKVAEAERLKVRRPGASTRSSASSGASSSSASNASKSSSSSVKKGRQNKRPAKREDPCDSPTTQRKILLCMRKCCDEHAVRAKAKAK